MNRHGVVFTIGLIYLLGFAPGPRAGKPSTSTSSINQKGNESNPAAGAAFADSLAVINPDFSAVPIVCSSGYAYQVEGDGGCFSGPVAPHQDFNSAPGFGWRLGNDKLGLGGDGLTGPNTAFDPPPFSGLPFTQAALLQNMNRQGTPVAVSQTIGGFSAGGTYTLSFYLGSRYNTFYDGNQTVEALIDDNVIGTWALISFTPFTLESAAFTVSAGGNHTLKFIGLKSGDHTAFLSHVAIAIEPTTVALSNFDGSNGSSPNFVTLAQGLDGNLYGTASQGGTFSQGTVFQVTLTGTLTAIYNFDSTHGAVPYAGLVLGTDGNFYGTTSQGGANGVGTVFQITPSGVLTTLHNFDGSDGANPEAALVQASDGQFYGTTYQGGVYGKGMIFRISSGGVFASVHTFQILPHPLGALVQGTDGNLYGTTVNGGFEDCGTFFRLHPGGEFDGLHNFNCTEASHPEAALVQGTDGKFYGTARDGGTGFGTLFKAGPFGAVTPLHSFDGSTEGGQPVSPLMLATDGNFYGTASGGGACGDNGAIFGVTPAGALTTLHTFCGTDGTGPEGGLVQHTNGNLYGVTMGGGTDGLGMIYSLKVGLSPSVKAVPASAPIGARVIILGTNLTGTTSVSFNGTAATFAAVSSSEITTTVPAGATTGTVQVVTPGGTLSGKFGVAPVISSFTPSSGPAGTSVVITGESFTGATSVAFGGVKATSFTVNSSTQITATVPSEARAGKIVVTTPGGIPISLGSFTIMM